ncbi:conserved membrane hypothetical protein [Magnetospirillum sp. LM-5]|uniref:hypothetical protein n=1 Tax=Magnetospirillum sp. LM-5 TaxID=2681466 RepID=UPI00137DBA8B|nr:hypothetical protein [Magnetospirillum sp. LM-5]CAA7615009.1 conserved membrane hypothetical protein [Magnetospirillum sp. LM-5]
MFAGAFMMGAKDRLLPPSVPFRFFATATLLHVVGWAVLAAGAGDLAGFTGGLGLPLAGLHLITLGVLAMAGMGAAFQMLPVATRRQLGPVWACRLTWVLFTPGVLVLSLGLATGLAWALHGGATLTVAGLALFGILIGRNLMQVSDLPGVTRHAWLAVASLAVLAGLGLVLVVDIDQGFLPDRAAFAAAHAMVAGYGFMGMLAMGFSYVLIPMFVLSQGVPDVVGKRTALLSAVALVLGVGGALAGWGPISALGAVVGLGAVFVYLKAQAAVLKGRMRKRLETFFRLVKAAWVLLPLGLLAAIALAFGLAPDVTAPLWGLLLVFGWLLSFVTGILQRIMPFLASMHSGANGGKPVLLSHLVWEPALTVHVFCHGGAVLLLAVGLIVKSPPVLTAGAVLGLVGAVSFASFTWVMMRRYLAYENAKNKGTP